MNNFIRLGECMRFVYFCLFCLIFLSSCAVQRYRENRYMLDFRPYVADNFIITPEQTIDESHRCLAMLTLEVIPGKVKQIAEFDSSVIKYNTWHEPTPQELLDMFVEYALKEGAEGIIGFNSTKITEGSSYYYVLTGWAIEIL